MELRHRLLIDLQEALRGSLLCHFVLKIPNAVAMRELLVAHTNFWENSTFEAAHIEEQVRIVFAVHRDERILPFDSCNGARQTVLKIMSDGS